MTDTQYYAFISARFFWAPLFEAAAKTGKSSHKSDTAQTNEFVQNEK